MAGILATTGILALLLILCSLHSFFTSGALEKWESPCHSSSTTHLKLWTQVEPLDTSKRKDVHQLRLVQIMSEKTESQNLTSKCILFIHGHAGSVGQISSLVRSLEDVSQYTRVFAMYSDEDFSALDSHIIQHQALFSLRAVKYLQHTYHVQNVTIVAHSMGGIVARSLIVLPEFTQDSVDTIITLATPHLAPPVSVEWDMVSLWDSINRVSLNKTVFVSIAGGLRDLQIQSHSADILSILPNSITAFTSSIPGVWMDLSHEGIMACPLLMNVLAKTLIETSFGNQSNRLKLWKRNLGIPSVGQEVVGDFRSWTRKKLNVETSLLQESASNSTLYVLELQKGHGFSVLMPSTVSPNLYRCRTQFRECHLANSFVDIPSNHDHKFLDLSSTDIEEYDSIAFVPDPFSAIEQVTFNFTQPSFSLPFSHSDAILGRSFDIDLTGVSTKFTTPQLYESFFHYIFSPIFHCSTGTISL
ncbi:PGAP1-domain-containing protein [Rhizoclosmatium globosum]|uniref:GPI inositol-deacylase n=1 Tax=Rhizoclosmatium globosum TaxID=329046 RepID=A0A1Y2C7V5_9FUNG|nr:PGAP1-domain-containing protein [Rhizoclosmatium globosum]|eukprot:ORY43109.1 PGAP1-domain-containing protein [Rhizoclosmatium globosum]